MYETLSICFFSLCYYEYKCYGFFICCDLQTSLDLLTKSSPTDRSIMGEGSSEAKGNKRDDKVLVLLSMCVLVLTLFTTLAFEIQEYIYIDVKDDFMCPFLGLLSLQLC